LGGGTRYLVSRRRVAVDRIDAAIAAHDLGEGDADVPAPGADVDAPPSLPKPEPIERRGQRPAVHVVPQTQLDHGERTYVVRSRAVPTVPTDDALADELVAAVRTFVAKEVLPVASDLEHADAYPDGLVEHMKAMGL